MLKFLNQVCIQTQQKTVVSRALSWKKLCTEYVELCPDWTHVILLHTQYFSENAAAQRDQVFDVTIFPSICQMLWFDILLFEKGTMNSANTVSTVNHQCDRLSLCSNTFSSKHREVKTPSKKPSKPFLSSRCVLNFAWGFAPVCP